MAVTASRAAGRATPIPTNKVIASGVAGALVTVAVFVLNRFVIKDSQNQIPADVSAALTTILSLVMSYYTRPSPDQTTLSDNAPAIAEVADSTLARNGAQLSQPLARSQL